MNIKLYYNKFFLIVDFFIKCDIIIKNYKERIYRNEQRINSKKM